MTFLCYKASFRQDLTRTWVRNHLAHILALYNALRHGVNVLDNVRLALSRVRTCRFQCLRCCKQQYLKTAAARTVQQGTVRGPEHLRTHAERHVPSLPLHRIWGCIQQVQVSIFTIDQYSTPIIHTHHSHHSTDRNSRLWDVR